MNVPHVVFRPCGPTSRYGFGSAHVATGQELSFESRGYSSSGRRAGLEADVARLALMYFVMPLWLLAGFADYLCHRAAHIESTSGPKESVLHLLLLAEMGVPVLAALFFEINAFVIAV